MPRHPDNQTRQPAGSASTSFQVEDVTCHVLSDGSASYEPGFLFANAAEGVLASAVRDRLDDDGLLSTPYLCLLLETPSATVLVDTGLGRLSAVLGAPAGQLVGSLSRAGLAPDDVDFVVLTHAHPDHIGGLSNGDTVTFPRARHVMSEVEWAFWTSEDSLAQLPEMLSAPARALLPALAREGQLELTKGVHEVVPGVRMIPAPGHTPGHCAVGIGSGQGSALFMADAVLDELHLTNPGWVSAVDHDEDQAVRTRRRLLDSSISDELMVLAYHMQARGRVERQADGYCIVAG